MISNKTETLSYFLPSRKSESKRNYQVNGEQSVSISRRQGEKVNPALVLGNVGLVYSLSKAGIPVYAGSEVNKTPSFYSRYVKEKVIFSTYRTEKFIDELCEFGKNLEHKPVIFSDDDDALLTISNHRERLSKYFLFSFPPRDVVESVLDKQEFSKLSRKYDLPAPASFNISSFEELKECAEQCDFPCIIKPVYRSDWYHEDFEEIVGEYKKAYKCVDKDELFDMYKRVSQIDKKVVLQEFIEGDDSHHYSVNMYVDKDGEVRGSYIAKKLRIYPIGAGMGSFITTVKDDEIIEKSKEVARALNLRGLLNIQFKRDSRTNEPKLIEIHFRNSVWGYIGVAANINLYEYYYHGLIGEELSSCKEYDDDVKYVDVNKDIAGFLQYRAAGELNFLDWLRTFKGKLIVGDLKVSDPIPFLVICWIAVIAKFQKNGYTRTS